MDLIGKEVTNSKIKPRMCTVNREYLKHMHGIDHRISVKYNNRPFVILAIYINNFLYAVPLTSTTNKDRIAQGKKARSSLFTIKIMDRDEEIAALLLNNMFPITEDVIQDLIINPITDTYELNEERFIRKNWGRINSKAAFIYINRYNTNNKNFNIYDKICCDFRKLEQACLGHDIRKEIK